MSKCHTNVRGSRIEHGYVKQNEESKQHSPYSSLYLKYPCRTLDTWTWVWFNFDLKYWNFLIAKPDTWACIQFGHRYKSLGNIASLNFMMLKFIQWFFFFYWYSTLSDRGFSWTVGLKEFAHPPQDPFSVIGTIGPTFFLAVAMFGFVFQLSSLVMEKELKLREVIFRFKVKLSNKFLCETFCSITKVTLHVMLCRFRRWIWWVCMILPTGCHGLLGKAFLSLFPRYSSYFLGWCFSSIFSCTTILQSCSLYSVFSNWTW